LFAFADTFCYPAKVHPACGDRPHRMTPSFLPYFVAGGIEGLFKDEPAWVKIQ
jgi:hypothetical protein